MEVLRLMMLENGFRCKVNHVCDVIEGSTFVVSKCHDRSKEEEEVNLYPN